MGKTKVKTYKRKRLGRIEQVKEHNRNVPSHPRISNEARVSIVNGESKLLILENRTLFSDPRYKKYSKIVTFDSKSGADVASKRLLDEFNDAKTQAKRLRIARVAQYSANRARVSFRRKDISEENRQKLKEISKVYGKQAAKFWKRYRTYKKEVLK